MIVETMVKCKNILTCSGLHVLGHMSWVTCPGSHVPCYEYLGSYRNTWKSTGGAEYPTCPTWAAIGIPLCHSTFSVSMSLLTRYVQWPIGGLGYLPWVILGTCPGLYVLVHVLGYMSCQFFSQKVRTPYATHVKDIIV